MTQNHTLEFFLLFSLCVKLLPKLLAIEYKIVFSSAVSFIVLECAWKRLMVAFENIFSSFGDTIATKGKNDFLKGYN